MGLPFKLKNIHINRVGGVAQPIISLELPPKYGELLISKSGHIQNDQLFLSHSGCITNIPQRQAIGVGLPFNYSGLVRAKAIRLHELLFNTD